MSILYVSKDKKNRRLVEIDQDLGASGKIIRNIESGRLSKTTNECFSNHYRIFVEPFGPEPIVYETDISIIYGQRSGCCLGCRWHPSVCQHCVRRLDTDGWVHNNNTEKECAECKHADYCSPVRIGNHSCQFERA